MRTITLNEDDMREPCDHNDLVTCGHCNRNWCGTCTPTPSARCPFEYEHEYDEDQEFAAFLANNDIKIDPNTPLAPHGGCNWSGCKTCFPPKDEVTPEDIEKASRVLSPQELELATRIVSPSPVNPKANGPCPTCGEPDGFHSDDVHRKNINTKNLLEKGWHNAK